MSAPPAPPLTIPSARAMRCLDCDAIFALVPGPHGLLGCPGCGSESVMPVERRPARHQYGGLIEGGTVACARCHKLLTAGEWFTPCEGRTSDG